MIKVIIVPDYNGLSAKAADFILTQVWEKPSSVLGLATGSTPLGLYRELIKASQEGRINFNKVITFNLDEYFGLAAEDKQSYHYFMRRYLFDQLNIPAENIFIPDGLISSWEARSYCRQYEKKIKKHGGIDLQILGLGRNGHIGFNEPGTPFYSRTSLVKLSKSTIESNARFFSDKSQVPKKAVTMGPKTIVEAKKIVLLAAGQDKAEAVAKAIEGPITTKVPASVLQRHHDVTFVIDEAAAGQLKKNYRSPLLLTNRKFDVYTADSLPERKNIVVVSPHPDDASISLGAIIYALSKRHNKIYTLVMTTGYRAFISNQDREQRIKIREREVVIEGKILGAEPIFLHCQFYDAKDQKKAMAADIKKVRGYLNKLKPEIIFLPHKKDSHPTHINSREVVLKALTRYNIFTDQQPDFWFYEGPWSIFSEGDFNTIFAFPKEFLAKKLQAIREQKSQVSRTRFDVAAESLAKLRAALIPEQALAGFGKQAPDVGEYFELFKVEKH